MTPRDALEANWTALWHAANDASFGADPPSSFAALVAFAKHYAQPITQASGIAPGFQATRASVAQSFVGWSVPLEGMTDYPYTDAEGLVTVGMGNLIDALAPGQKMHVNCGHGTTTPAGLSAPSAKARALPWTGGDIGTDWTRIKQAWPRVQSTACKEITSCRLDKATISNLILTQMKSNEAEIIKDIPSFPSEPADAQLGIHGMSWAMGPGQFAYSWVAFKQALARGDYAAAAAQSGMRGVGIDIRNLAHKLLFLNAAQVHARGTDPDHLYYLDGLSAFGIAGPTIAAAARAANVSYSASSAGLLSVITDHPVISGSVALAFLAALVAGGRKAS
jgi:GH24 family phage-related lysozyme (muramidase)